MRAGPRPLNPKISRHHGGVNAIVEAGGTAPGVYPRRPRRPRNEGPALATVSTGKNEPNLQFWVERLRDRDASKRLHAVTVLGSLGPRARAALPALLEALPDPSLEVRRLAAVALGEVGPEGCLAVPALIQALQDEDETVRRRVVAALYELGQE